LTQAPDYYSIIKKPMDFMSMKTKLYRFEYHTPSEIVDDIRLMLSNCELYNREGAPERLAGESLGRYLDQRLRDINLAAEAQQKELEKQHRRSKFFVD
jgi:hypothetical protein